VLQCGTCHVVLGVCGECVGSVLGVCWECVGSVLGVCWECVGSALQCDMCHMRFVVLQCGTRHVVLECVAVCWECVAVRYVSRTVQRIPHPPE